MRTYEKTIRAMDVSATFVVASLLWLTPLFHPPPLMPRKNRKPRAKRRNAQKLSGRSGGSRGGAQVITRQFVSPAALSFNDTSGDVVGAQSIGTLLDGYTDWTSLSELYQEWRLARFEVRYMPMLTQDQIGYDGVIVMDPLSNFDAGLNPLDYALMRGARLWSNNARTSNGWSRWSWRPNQPRVDQGLVANCAPGSWLQTADPTQMTGKVFFTGEISTSGTTSTVGEQVLRMVWITTVEFRNPVTVAAEARPSRYLVPVVPKLDTEGKEEKKESKVAPRSDRIAPRSVRPARDVK